LRDIVEGKVIFAKGGKRDHYNYIPENKEKFNNRN
jgi:uncharacterized protein related to proFAR isomerase